MKLRKGRLCAALAVLAFVAAAGTGCAGKVVGTAQYGNNTSAQIQEIPEATTTAEPTTEPPVEDKRVHVVAAGDNAVITVAEAGTDGKAKAVGTAVL